MTCPPTKCGSFTETSPRCRAADYLALSAVLTVFLWFGSDAVMAATPTEYQVKAAFLYNFAKFVTYPVQALPADNSPFVIGILGDDPFGSLLDQTILGKSINDHKIIIRRSDNLDDLRHCQILFISASHRKDIGAILARVKADNVLTVGETEGFAAKGGVINFYVAESRVRFEINPKSADRAGLQISAQLLRLGHVVADDQSANRN